MKERKIKILLLEDDANDLLFIKEALKKFTSPESLLHFENGADMLDYIFEKDNYTNKANDIIADLIILDLKTPKINGLEVLQKLKAEESTNSIPVVIFTSSNEEKDLRKSYEYGANSFIVKPIDFETFSKTIESVGNYWTNINQV
ncbi:MAG: response regulator [Ignavibacteria bacterium]|jgi:two-component system response regulator|nr:response regulator [Ignavibacteria bacterium]